MPHSPLPPADPDGELALAKARLKEKAAAYCQKQASPPPNPWRRDPYPSNGRTFVAWMSDQAEARVFFDAAKGCLLQSPTGARLPVGLEVLAWRDLEVVEPPDPSFDIALQPALQPQALRSADRDEDSLVGTSDHRPFSRSQGLGRQHWMPYPVPSWGSWRGHQLQKRGDDYYYADGVAVADDPDRPCGHCGLANTDSGHDGCLGEIPGVINACCGHGVASSAWVVLSDGTRLAGAEAMAFFEEAGDAAADNAVAEAYSLSWYRFVAGLESTPAAWPSRIRPVRVVRSDLPFTEPDLAVSPTLTYHATSNRHGAVCAVLPDGNLLGMKPGEFEVVSWSRRRPTGEPVLQFEEGSDVA